MSLFISFVVMTDPDIFTRLNFLFGTEKQRRIRIFSVLCREKLIITFPVYEHQTYVLSGSISDGVGYPKSDDDTMVVFTPPDYLPRLSVEEAVQYNAPLMIPSDTSPGYCLLWIPDVYRHRGRGLCANGYLSSLAWKTPLIEQGDSLHGPCVTGFKGDLEFDLAVCLPLVGFPDIASEWINRTRQFGWPSYSIIQQIVSKGCHVVPIGDPDSPMADHQWRISFSLAERTLVHTFNHTQFLTYSVLKLVLKRIINVHEPNCMCSYFIKTSMFYCIENTEIALWDKKRLELCYRKCLTLLYHFVDEMFCPNYFVKNNNMFKRKINPTNRPRVLSLLQWLLRLGLSGAMCHTGKGSIMKIHIAGNISEAKSDMEIFNGYVFRMFEIELGMSIYLQAGDTNKIIRILVDTAHACFRSDNLEAREVMLLCLRLCSGKIAGTLESALRTTGVENKYIYTTGKLVDKLYKRGSHCDVSFGRLRYATHLYMVNDLDKCLVLIQETLSAIAPYVLMTSCKTHDLINMYQQVMCGRNLSIAEKSKVGFARTAEFYTYEHSIIPAPISIFMCRGCAIGCTGDVIIDPIIYAYFLQGLCFFKLQNWTKLRNSVEMLQDRLKNNNFVEEGVPYHFSIAYSMLGRIDLLQGRLREAIRYFVKSFLLREEYKKGKGNEYLQSETINYALLNLGIACNHWMNSH